MLLRVLLLSLALFGASCSADRAAKFATHQLMSIVESAVKTGNIEPITFILDPKFNFSMCGYRGNMENFKGYLQVQIEKIMDIKFLVDYDNAEIETTDNVETLTFHVDTTTLYRDRSRVEAGAVVTATRGKYGALFKLSHIEQRCRITSKRHHRLYRLFTNENLYDYKK